MQEIPNYRNMSRADMLYIEKKPTSQSIEEMADPHPAEQGEQDFELSLNSKAGGQFFRLNVSHFFVKIPILSPTSVRVPLRKVRSFHANAMHVFRKLS